MSFTVMHYEEPKWPLGPGMRAELYAHVQDRDGRPWEVVFQLDSFNLGGDAAETVDVPDLGTLQIRGRVFRPVDWRDREIASLEKQLAKLKAERDTTSATPPTGGTGK